MKRPPRDPSAHILNRNSIIDLLWCGLIIGGLAIANYLLFYTRSGVQPHDAPEVIVLQATTMTYTTIVLCQLVNIMQRRSVHGFFTRYQLSNKYFWIAIAGSFGVVLSIAYVPAVSIFFKSGPIGMIDWLYIIAAAGIFLTIRETQRIATRRFRRHSTLAKSS